MNLASLDFAAIAWTQLWQVTIVALMVGVVARLVCRRRPHLAYLLWMLVLIKALTPPFAASPTGLFSWAMRDTSVQPAVKVAAHSRRIPLSAVDERPPAEAQPPTIVETPVEPPIHVSLGGAFLALWVAGLVLFSGYVGVKWTRIKRQWFAGAAEVSAELRQQARAVAARLGVRCRARIVVSPNATVPAVFGVWRATLLLPDKLIDRMTTLQLEAILAHELVHIRRRDPAAALLQLFAQLVWWFHPLIWWTNREARRERERACDEEVVAGLGCRPADYARTLLAVLELQPRRSPAFMPGVGMLEVTARRLEHIVRRSGSFHRRTPPTYYAIALVALALTLPGAGLRASADEKTAGDEKSEAAEQQGVPPSGAERRAKAPTLHAAEPAVLGRLRELGAKISDSVIKGKRQFTVYLADPWKGNAADLALLDELSNLGQLHLFFELQGLAPEIVSQLKLQHALESLALSHLSDKSSETLNSLPKNRVTMLLDCGLTPDGWRRVLKLVGDVEQLQLQNALAASDGKSLATGITDEGLADVAMFHNLKVLVLHGASISDAGIKHLAGLEKLESLMLAECPGVNGEGFADLAQLPMLRLLSLADVPLAPKSLESIARLSHLESLSLYPAKFEPGDVAPLARLSNLRLLSLGGRWSANEIPKDVPLGDAILTMAGQLPNLRVLSVMGIGTSDDGLEAVTKAEKLQTVELYGVGRSDRSLELVSRLTRLRRLTLNGEGTITDRGLASLKKMTKLTQLELPVSDITDQGLSHLADVDSLESLDLSNSKITGIGMAALGRLTKLKTLSLANSAFNDEGSVHLVQFSKLERLDLTSTVVTDPGIASIGKLANLRVLNLSNTAITDAGLDHLRDLKQLGEVYVIDAKVTKQGVAQLRAAIPGVSVSDGSQFTYVGRLSIHSIEDDEMEAVDNAEEPQMQP